MVVERGAEMPEAGRPVLRIAGMMVMMMLGGVMFVVGGIGFVMVLFTASISLALMIEVNDRVADMDVIIAMESVMERRRNDSSISVDENRPDPHEERPQRRSHRYQLYALDATPEPSL